MFSVPAEYYRLLMSPTVNRFLKAPTEYDLCFSACIFVFHFCDVKAKHEGFASSEDVRQLIEKRNPLINVVQAVCVAAKHVEVGSNKVTYKGFRAEDTKIGRSAAYSDGSSHSDGSGFSDAIDVVRAKMPDGSTHDMAFTVRSVVKTIETEFLG